jgi:hypothetical protein
VIKIAQVSNKALGGAGVVMGSVISLLNLSSPLAVWIIANQVQLLMLLLLTGAFLTPSIISVLT